MVTKLNTVRLKNGSEYPLSASWNDLTDKPFHTEVTETVLVPETELTFSYDKSANVYAHTESDTSDIAEKMAGDWNKAIVVFDGVRYDAPKRLLKGAAFIGDLFRIEIGVAVTGEPFIAVLENDIFIIDVFADTVPDDPDNVPDVTHTVSITLVKETVKKLEDVYQHQPDWNNTDQSSAACIKNRPFGLVVEDGSVWAEQDVVWSTDNGAAIAGIDVAPLLCAGKILLEVDGTKYISTEVYGGDGVPDDAIEVGFVDADGNHAYVSTASTEEATGIADGFGFIPSGESILTDGQTIHVKVTVFGSRKQIDKDYLPILDKESAIVLDSLVKFSYDAELGNWVSSDMTITGELFERALNAYPEIVVDSDKLTTNDHEKEGLNRWVRFGNYTLFGGTGGEEYPFGILFTKTTADDVTSYTMAIRLVGDAPTDTSTTQTHYINLRFSGDEDTYTIKREYLPDPPEFDLTAMGLAVVSVGGSVSVACDTAALRAALDKGNVKITLSYQAGAGITAQVTFIGAAMQMSGTYRLSFVGALGSTPMLFNVEVTDTSISAQIITLAV